MAGAHRASLVKRLHDLLRHAPNSDLDTNAHVALDSPRERWIGMSARYAFPNEWERKGKMPRSRALQR